MVQLCITMFELDKFLCGFFIGVILYFTVFENTFSFNYPFVKYDIKVFQSFADQMIFDDDKESNFRLPELDSDLRFHHDVISKEGRELKNSITISCFIFLTGSCKFGATAINRTWGKRCNHIRFLVNKGSKTCGLPVLYLNQKAIRQKYAEAIKKIYPIYENEYDWTILATDDNYIIMENLLLLLNTTSPNSPTMIGYISDYQQRLSKYSSVTVFSKSAMVKFFRKFKSFRCKSSSNVYDSLCMKQLGINYDPIKSRLLNVIPPELRIYPQIKGIQELDRHIASFRYVNPKKMVGLEFIVYHLRPYGVQ